jgi:hypothetical protein
MFRLFRQVPRTDELPRRVYLRYLNAEWPKVGRFEMDVAKSLSTAADTRPLTKGCRRTMAPMKGSPVPSSSALDVYEARVAKRFLLDDDEGGLRPLAPRLDSNSKQDQQTDKYEESDRIQVDQGCGKLPDEQDQIDLTDHWNERQEPPRE